MSLRSITKVAGVNLAAVNYHFSDKETLYREVVMRRIRPLSTLQLSLLAESCARFGTTPPPLDQIIDMMARPLFDLYRTSGPGGRSFVQILSRSLTQPPGTFTQLITNEYNPVLVRFGQLIRRHTPRLSPEEFLWRLSFVVGAMHHTLATLHQMSALTSGICHNDDYDGSLSHFIAHAMTIFRAPPIEVPDPSSL